MQMHRMIIPAVDENTISGTAEPALMCHPFRDSETDIIENRLMFFNMLSGELILISLKSMNSIAEKGTMIIEDVLKLRVINLKSFYF